VRSGERSGATAEGKRRRGRPLCRDFVDPRSTELAESIAAHQRVISEHEGAMVREVGEFNGAECWRADGALSMADWLVARLHLSGSRARRLVEASERLPLLPALSGAVCEGRVPLDVATVVAKIATTADDAELAAAAEQWTPREASQLVSQMKGQTASDSAAQFGRRCVRFNDEKCSLWAQLPKDGYALVKSALWSRARRHDHPSTSDPEYERFESRCADALVEVCVEGGRSRPDGGAPHGGGGGRGGREPAGADGAGAGRSAGAGGSGQATLVVHADLDRLLYGDGYGHASIEGAGPISAEVARRVACSANITLSLDAPDGTVLDQKALGRDPTDAQRIEVRRRDGGCRFPGCMCRSVTDVHHVTWVSKQGPTVMSNLLTLCAAHHSRVHELGWKLDGDAQAEVRFTSPSGRVFVSTPLPTWRRPRK
jgi:hypothetical protein